MKNKNIFQEKITRMESMMNIIGRAVSTNEREKAYEVIEQVKSTLGDMQTMLNREDQE